MSAGLGGWLGVTRAQRMVASALVTLMCAASSAWAGLPIARWTHASGAMVYLVHSPGIAMVDVQLDFDAGERRSPLGQSGLAGAMAAATGAGVRANAAQSALDENELGQAWADLGAIFSASAGIDRLTFSLRSLSRPEVLSAAAGLAARQMGEPVFAQSLWLRDRQKMIASIRESNTRAATVAARTFAAAVYGSHPYGRQPTESDVLAIQSSDLRALHERSVRACYARVSIVGDVDRMQADALVDTLLSRMPQQNCPVLPEVEQVHALAHASQQNIAFDAAQAQVLVGQPGIKRDSPDFIALLVGNHILGGGGFTSRLTEEVREKRGLTYGVSSGFAPGLHAGAFTVSLQTRPDQARQALDLVRDVLQRFVDGGPTAAELQAAKDNLIGGFALRIDSNRKLLDNVANIAWNGLPLDYLDTWTARVQALTVDEIRAAFARTLQVQTMATVVLGAK